MNRLEEDQPYASTRPGQVRLVYLTSHPMTIRLKLADQIDFMIERGFDVSVITADGDDLQQIKREGKFPIHTVAFEREISPWRDFRCLLQVIREFRKLKPTIVNASTPKAGLIGMLAAWWTRVPVRIYTLRGLRHETLSGLKGWIVRTIERVTAACAHRVIVVGDSLKQAYIRDGLSSEKKVVVLGAGSSNGLDASRFDFGERTIEVNGQLRKQHGIAIDAPVLGFVGRFTRDKGLTELADAFRRVVNAVPNAVLLMIGGFEEGDPVPHECRQWLENHPQVVVVPFVDDTAQYYSVMDVLAFPSYREGLPVVPLEAAAAGVPCVASNATGCIDAVLDQVTGRVVPVRDAEQLADALVEHLEDDALRARHGNAARERVKTEFSPHRVWQLIAAEYNRQLEANGLAAVVENENQPDLVHEPVKA